MDPDLDRIGQSMPSDGPPLRDGGIGPAAMASTPQAANMVNPRLPKGARLDSPKSMLKLAVTGKGGGGLAGLIAATMAVDRLEADLAAARDRAAAARVARDEARSSSSTVAAVKEALDGTRQERADALVLRDRLDRELTHTGEPLAKRQLEQVIAGLDADLKSGRLSEEALARRTEEAGHFDRMLTDLRSGKDATLALFKTEYDKLTDAERSRFDALVAAEGEVASTAMEAKDAIDETNALARQLALADQAEQEAKSNLGKQLGLPASEIEKQLQDPTSLVSRRLKDTKDWQAEREGKRTRRSRYGEIEGPDGKPLRLRIETDAMTQGARATRDRVNGTAQSMRSIANDPESRKIVGQSGPAIERAKDAARAAKDAAKLARRMQQYGSLDRVRAAFGEAKDAASLAGKAESVVNAYHEAVRVAANPDSNPEAQKVLLGKALANAQLADAELANQLAPSKATGAALEAAKAAFSEAQAAFLDGIRSGLIGLEHTQWPNCPKDGSKKDVFPKSVEEACRKDCAPWTFHLIYARPDKEECERLEEEEEEDGVKGKGLEPLAPGETSDQHAVRAPESERVFPPNTAANGARHPTATAEDDAVERRDEQNQRAEWQAHQGMNPAERAAEAMRKQALVVKPDPKGLKPGDAEAGAPGATPFDPDRKMTKKEFEAWIKAEAQRRFELFEREMERRADGTKAIYFGPWRAIHGYEESWEFKGKAYRRKIPGNKDKILALIETRVRGDVVLAGLDVELKKGVSEERRQEIELDISRIQLGDALAHFKSVELAGGRQYVGILEDALAVVETAQRAESLHTQYGKRTKVEFMQIAVEAAGPWLERALNTAPDLYPRLNRNPPTGEAAAKLGVRVRAAREAYNDTRGLGGTLRRAFEDLTGGHNAEPWQRAAILLGNLAIGAATGGAGLALAGGRSALTAIAVGATAGAVGAAISDAFTQAIETKGFTTGEFDGMRTLISAGTGGALGVFGGAAAAGGRSAYSQLSLASALREWGGDSTRALVELGKRAASKTAAVSGHVAHSAADALATGARVVKGAVEGAAEGAGGVLRRPSTTFGSGLGGAGEALEEVGKGAVRGAKEALEANVQGGRSAVRPGTTAGEAVVSPEGGEVLYRFGTAPEPLEKLAGQAEEALRRGIGKDKVHIHGVSVTARQPTKSAASSAPRDVIEGHFPVHDTATRDPFHKTVELPRPLTQEDVDLFNRLLGRQP